MATSPSALTKSSGKYGDLKRRLLFLLLALVVYRVGAHVPVPGKELLITDFRKQQGETMGTFSTVLTLFLVPAVYVILDAVRSRRRAPGNHHVRARGDPL